MVPDAEGLGGGEFGGDFSPPRPPSSPSSPIEKYGFNASRSPRLTLLRTNSSLFSPCREKQSGNYTPHPTPSVCTQPNSKPAPFLVILHLGRHVRRPSGTRSREGSSRVHYITYRALIGTQLHPLPRPPPPPTRSHTEGGWGGSQQQQGHATRPPSLFAGILEGWW